MNILIVEDDQNKLVQLRSLITRLKPGASIECRSSYRSGLACLKDGVKFDLVLLDMSMPTYDRSPTESGGRPRPFAGKEILRKLERYGVKVPVVVVTQFSQFGEPPNSISLETLKKQLSSEGYSNYKKTVFYSAGGTTWEQELQQIITSQDQ